MPELRYLVMLSAIFVLVVAALRVVLGVNPDVVNAYAILVGAFGAIVVEVLRRRR